MAYLTPAEYVARYGEAEAVRLTDETKSGTVDDAKVAAEIAAQEAFVESYLGGRYVLPLDPPPSIIVGFVGDLVREGLHRVRPVEAVTAAADRARKFLRDLSDGKAVLPVATAESDAPQGGSPVRSNDAEPDVFGGCALDGYLHPQLPGYC